MYSFGPAKVSPYFLKSRGAQLPEYINIKVNGKKKSFHDDGLFADVAIVDPKFIKNSDFTVIKNSAIDACAQCTEAFDSKLSNPYTKFLCNTAFEILENAILIKTIIEIVINRKKYTLNSSFLK